MSIKRQTAWNMVPLLVTSATGIVSLPLFLRFFGNDLYALWSYVATLAGMFGFADMGLGSVIGRYVGVALGKNDSEGVRGYWGTGNLIILPFLVLASLVFMGLGIWFGPRWFNIAPADAGLLRGCFVAAGLGLFFGYYGNHWMILSQAFLEFRFISVVRVAVTLLQIIPALLLAGFTRNPLLVMGWGALVNALQLVVFIWHARRKYQMGFHFRAGSRARIKEMAAYALKNLLVLVVNSVFGPIDRVLLGRFVPAAQYSYYAFSANAASRLQSLSTSVMGPVLYNAARVADRTREAARIYNETFFFVFDWYLLAAVWVGLWHPVLLRVWLNHTMGETLGAVTAAHVGPLMIPLVLACCFNSIANISAAQLASLNRLGATVMFYATAGLLAIAGVWIGWDTAGIEGAAYGFLLSRAPLVAQDLFVVHLMKAGGWLAGRTWLKMGKQCAVAAVFASSYLVFKVDSYWLLIPAGLHAGLVAGWLLRHTLRRFPIWKKFQGYLVGLLPASRV